MASADSERVLLRPLRRQLHHHLHGNPQEVQEGHQRQSQPFEVQVLRLEEAQDTGRTRNRPRVAN